jgi:deoxycytidine triphosphate deaminase
MKARRRKDWLQELFDRSDGVRPDRALVRYDREFAAFQQRYTIDAARQRAAEKLAEWRRTNLEGELRLTA